MSGWDGLFRWGFAAVIALSLGVWLSVITLCSSEREVAGSIRHALLAMRQIGARSDLLILSNWVRKASEINIEKATLRCCNASKPVQNSVRNQLTVCRLP